MCVCVRVLMKFLREGAEKGSERGGGCLCALTQEQRRLIIRQNLENKNNNKNGGKGKIQTQPGITAVRFLVVCNLTVGSYGSSGGNNNIV